MNATPSAAVPHRFSLRINGQTPTVAVDAWVTLLDLLRDCLQHTATKKGCDHGQCGAGTVLLKGRRVLSRRQLAVMHERSDITKARRAPLTRCASS